jgi:hypothetical protein
MGADYRPSAAGLQEPGRRHTQHSERSDEDTINGGSASREYRGCRTEILWFVSSARRLMSEQCKGYASNLPGQRHGRLPW